MAFRQVFSDTDSVVVGHGILSRVVFHPPPHTVAAGTYNVFVYDEDDVDDVGAGETIVALRQNNPWDGAVEARGIWEFTQGITVALTGTGAWVELFFETKTGAYAEYADGNTVTD